MHIQDGGTISTDDKNYTLMRGEQDNRKIDL